MFQVFQRCSKKNPRKSLIYWNVPNVPNVPTVFQFGKNKKGAAEPQTAAAIPAAFRKNFGAAFIFRFVGTF
jgi:hypothetical protein